MNVELFSSHCASATCVIRAERVRLADSRVFWMRGLSGSEALSGQCGSLVVRSIGQSSSRFHRETTWYRPSSSPSDAFSAEPCATSRNREDWNLCRYAHGRPSLKGVSSIRTSSTREMVSFGASGGGWTLQGLDYHALAAHEPGFLTEGPSCIFVGPLETAEKARLEALYQQARDSYYSGRPLIVDDMFDRVETKLRWHGSKVVLKYPRCSLKRYSAYADAELDSSQMWALASVWGILLASGIVAAAGPPACAINKACQKIVHLRFASHGVTAASETVTAFNGILAIGMGLMVGVPIAMAAARALEGLWRGELMALKGCCPNCGEEVYAFVRADQSGQPQHKTECHVCEHPLVFRANVEHSHKHPGRLWAYGRVYLSTQSKDLEPSKKP